LCATTPFSERAVAEHCRNPEVFGAFMAAQKKVAEHELVQGMEQAYVRHALAWWWSRRVRAGFGSTSARRSLPRAKHALTSRTRTLCFTRSRTHCAHSLV
jgi:hypothetical protein